MYVHHRTTQIRRSKGELASFLLDLQRKYALTPAELLQLLATANAK